jgi:hypothetical protein
MLSAAIQLALSVTGRRPGSRRSLSGGLACVVALLLITAPTPAQSSGPSEYQLKAAFLFNFVKFIDWPDQSFASPQAPFSVCVIGQDPFGPALDDSLAGKTVGAHAVQVNRFPNPRSLADAQHCQIAFISTSERDHLHEVIDSFHGCSVLLVGDVDGFVASGGTIEFLIEADHIRFAINPEAADRADLKVSSKLLALARIEHDDPVKGRN